MKALLALLIIFTLNAYADCSALTGTTLTTGKAGQIQMSVAALDKAGKIMYCDGTTWQDLGGSPTATACTKSGEITISAGEMRYCNNGFYWAFDSGAVTNGTCTKTGQIRWNVSQLEFCNGTNWRVVSADTNEDPIASYVAPLSGIGDFIGRNFFASGYTGNKVLNVTINNSGTCNFFKVRLCGTSACTFSSSFISERTTNGTLSVPNGTYIYAFFAASQNPSTACSIDMTLGSQTFSSSATTVAVDNHPSFGIPPFLRNVTALSTAISGTNTVSNFTSGTISISDNGNGGNPEFIVCADAGCSTVLVPWGSAPASISNGQYFGFRTTMGAGTQNLREVVFNIGTQGPWKWYAMTSTCPATTTLAAGGTLTCTCPANYANVTQSTTATGSSTYSQASDVCRAALHAGAYSNATGGSITVRGNTAATCPTFAASTANGVTTLASSTAAAAMYFQGFGSNACN